MDISSKIPPREQTVPVYAVIVLMVYGWNLYWFYYNLPGWAGFMNLGEIWGQFAYSMSNNFLESLAVLAGIVLLAVALPRSWFADAFVARGAALAILGLGLMIYVARQFQTKEYYPAELIRWWPALLAAVFAAAYGLGTITLARKALELFADRAIIFLYISIPVSLLSLLTVLLRSAL